MLKKLSPAQYALVLPLYAPLEFNLVIRSVVEGNTPAWVYVDRPASPGAALIWDRQDALLLAGDNQEMAALAGLRNLLHNHILPDARARWIPELALFFTPGWDSMLPVLLDGLNARPARRFRYIFPPEKLPEPLLPPPGFRLERIDKTLLAAEMEHLDQARGWIDSFWHSGEDFLRTGFGFCAVNEEQRQVAAWCLTVFAARGACELGVATMSEYRSRGLASLVSAACIRHALQSELAVHWHCWADNLPSVAVANKLGFRLEREYLVYRLNTGLQPAQES